ncbi:MAG: hypothetical protein KY445_15375, partial [Armatimonadetes bacterium]|nr:hypothetical protein [Armatimonadota bacterium]
MQFHDALGEREAKSCALFLAGVGTIHLLESPKNALLIFGRDADAAVFHANHHKRNGFRGISGSFFVARAHQNGAATGS